MTSGRSYQFLRQPKIGALRYQITVCEIRIDIFERLGDLVCVYDLKTGKRRLSGGRIHEIADNVYSVYPRTRRALVIEVRVK